MAEEDKIKYSDIIEPDGSIENLIKQLGELNKSYEAAVVAIRAGAAQIAHSIKSASGATTEGRKAIDEATSAASRLERAQKELALATSDTGKQIAWLKAQTAEANKITVEQQRYIKQTASSYDRLKSDLKESTELYKSLTAAERADSEMGQQLLSDIINLTNQIRALDNQMKPHVQVLSEVEKAEQKLAYLQSEEGKKLLELKAKIAEVTAKRKEQKATVDPLVEAEKKLAFAQSEENLQLKFFSSQIQKANKIAQLRAQINASAEGSYDRLSAKYALNKIRLNEMSAAEREATNVGKALEEETLAIYNRMIQLQESTGNFRLSVGNYKKTWDGLGFSISQVVRELPAATVSLNTFFLGISNNVPMVVDEINKLKLANKQLAADGLPTVNITKQIIKSLFSWNTALVLVLTALSMFGSKLSEWIKSLSGAKNKVIELSKALKNIGEELKNTNNGYGDSITTLKKLQSAWNDLKTTAEKNQWIKDNESEFKKLGIAVNNINEADNAFIDNTEAVIEALKQRAKAAAAQKLAAEQYEEALLKVYKADQEKKELTKREAQKEAGQISSMYAGNANMQAASAISLDVLIHRSKNRIEDLEKEADVAEKTGDAYFKLADGYEKAAKAALDAAGIDTPHKKARKAKGRKPIDLTHTLDRNDTKIQKEYEESVTSLLNDEFAKRRKAAADQVQDENNKLREMYKLNEEYVSNVDGKYKELTDSQKKQIEKQQNLITKTIANNLKKLEKQLQKIQNEQKVASLQTWRNTINPTDLSGAERASENKESTITTNIVVTRDISRMEESLADERKLMEENLELEYSLVLDTNKKLLDAGDEHARSEKEILIEFNRKRVELWKKYDQKILDIREKDINDQLKLVKKGSDEELELLLKQIEIARQKALAENIAKPAEQQTDTDTINALFDKSSALAKGEFEMNRFDQQQALDEAVFNEVKRSELAITKFKLEQEKARWLKQIELAKAGALDWSQAQIDAAESTVRKIDMELEDLKFSSRIGEKGLFGAILEQLGVKDDAIKAFDEFTSHVISNLQAIADAEVELAEKAVAAAEERVSAAQKAYDAEVEARSNGYANNVETARKELEQEKKKMREKQKLLEEAQRRQEALDSITQASSLITASANIWKSFSSMGPFGPALAIAAIASMWTSFAAAKIKAKQVAASQSEEYGEGGLEFLEGGSHASGNDIDLGTSNKEGKRMRAEGGEALAIINKKRTRKYRKILPDVVDSLNKGTFEDKYLNAFAKSNELSVSFNSNTNTVDLSKIENDVRSIRKQNEIKYYMMPDGTVVIQEGNIRRIIKN